MSDLYGWLHELSGPEYSYLGHFLDMHNLCQGHNDMEDAEKLDEGIAGYGSGRAPSGQASTVTES